MKLLTKLVGEKMRIALAQISCKRGNKKENIQKMIKYVERAKENNADLIIFPELSITGYVLRDLIYELAEIVPDGTSTKELEKVAKQNKIYIVFGLPEKSEKAEAVIYNTAVLVGPEGYIGKYRKMHLPTHSVFEEKRYFRLGYEISVFETEIGRIGLMICYDIFFPEVARLLKLKGAQLITCISASPSVRKTFFEILTAARAIENNSFLAYVNLVGVENGLEFWGGSRLISPSGNIITKAEYDKEDFILGEINLKDTRHVETFVPVLKDLRPELYEKMKTYAENM